VERQRAWEKLLVEKGIERVAVALHMLVQEMLVEQVFAQHYMVSPVVARQETEETKPEKGM